MARGQIYTELSDIVAPRHSMLVVWDMHNALVNKVFNKDEVLSSVSALLRAARRLQVPVVYSKITHLPLRFQAPSATAHMMKRASIKDVKQLRPSFEGDPTALEIPGVIAPQGEDIVLNKHIAGSIFIGTSMDYIARYGGIETLIFTGVSTDWGIDSSAREALNLGYYVVVVSDGVSSSKRDAHERSLANLRNLCEVVAHADILKIWSGHTQ